VIAILQIQPDIRLRTDSYASLESQGLTGVTYVEVSGGTPTAPFLVARPGEEIPTIPYRPSTFQQIVQSAPQLLDRLNTMAARGNDLLSEQNRQAFTDTLTNLSRITAAVNEHTEDIDRVLANLDVTVERLDRALQTADRALGTADTALASVGKAGDNIATLATNTDTVIARDAAELTRLVGDTRALIASLTRLSTELERQPTQLIFGDRRPGYTPQ
jgi:phospholipid/cholesterol/gamma-HCH transport system substrate-binding protein